MITAKRLRELLEQVPDDAGLTAYEGEGIGLHVRRGKQRGWIDTGSNDDVCEDYSPDHDLTAFTESQERHQ